MVEIILQLHGNRCDLLVAENLNAENDSPLCCAEALHKSVADAQLYPQILSSSSAFETPGQKGLRTGFPAKEGTKSRFTENLRPGNKRPSIGPAEPAPAADTVEKLAPVWTAGHGRIIERTNVDTELARISEGAGVAGSKKSKHRAVPGVGHVIGALSRRKDKLRARTQTKQASRFSKQENVNPDTGVGHGVGIGSEAH
jgi:hypothetical protein